MAFFDPELRYATGAIDLHATGVIEEERLGLIGAQAPVTMDDTPGQEQWITVLPVAMPVELDHPFGPPVKPMVQVFECDMGCTSAFSICLTPENALRLAQALIGAVTLSLDGELTATVQERVNGDAANG